MSFFKMFLALSFGVAAAALEDKSIALLLNKKK